MIKVEDNFTGRAPEKAEDTELPAAEPELSFSAEQLHDHATGRRAAIHEKAANMRLQWQERTGNAEKEIGLPDDDALTVRREINVDGRTADISARSLALEEEAAAKIEGVTGIPKEAPERQTASGVRLKTDYPPEKLRELRDPLLVGKEKYGAGLVNSHQKKGMSVPEQEAAQEQAIIALDGKIAARVVDPEAIGADMMAQLEVKPDLEGAPEQPEQILEAVHAELDSFVEKKFITPEEANLIKQEAASYQRTYMAAFPDAPPEKIFEIVRDNSRKIAYQTKMDKEVFSGSDHGTRHILEGNMKFADQMVQSLQDQGVAVSPIDQVLIRQVIIDHDCGYTCGCAQAKKGFEASKDHPVFSAKFIGANKDYYVDKFGEEAYETIRNSVLYHSYPVAEYQSNPKGAQGINSELVRSITSTVDSLGVTAETKTPAFFRKPEAIGVLLKIKLAMEFSDERNKDGDAVLPEEQMARYKKELMSVADSEENILRREGFRRSIGDFFNEFTANTTLGHYTGVVERVAVAKENGKMVPKVNMSMSRVHALLGDLFGGKMETAAFAKAMGDFGIGKGELEQFGKTLENARRRGEKPEQALQFKSDRAVFEIAPQFAEDAGDSFADIREMVAKVYNASIRVEINALLSDIESNPEEADRNTANIQAKFESGITEKTTADELIRLRELTEALRDKSDSGTQGNEGKSLTRAQVALRELRRFKTQREREILGE